VLQQSEALRLFEYRDGKLYWKVNKRNQTKIGFEAGTDHKGYRRVQVGKNKYLSHRVIYLMHYGHMPKIVDHIDGNPENNNITNLRDATYQQNALNVKPRKDSKTGYQNVGYHKGQGRWYVHLTIYGKRTSLGYYDDLELASLVAEEARDKFYGDYARRIPCLR
jgi:hypothetical protein